MKARNSIIIALLGVIIALWCLRSCESKKEPVRGKIVRINDTIKIETENVKRLDSVRLELQLVRSKYKYLLSHPNKYFYHDTTRIDSLVYSAQESEKLIIVDSAEIVSLKNIIKLHEKKDTLQNKEIDSLKHAPTKYWKGFLHGFGTGFATGVVIPK